MSMIHDFRKEQWGLSCKLIGVEEQPVTLVTISSPDVVSGDYLIIKTTKDEVKVYKATLAIPLNNPVNCILIKRPIKINIKCDDKQIPTIEELEKLCECA